MTTILKDNISENFLAALPSIKDDKALNLLKDQGLPSTKNEEYKYTAITKKIASDITDFHQASPALLSDQDISGAAIDGLEAYILVLNNGILDLKHSTLPVSGFAITEIADSTTAPFHTDDITNDSFMALNRLSYLKGISIHIPRNTVLDKPVMVLNFIQSTAGQIISPKIWIEGAENAEAIFLEKTISLDKNPYFLNGSIEVKVGSNSHLHYYRIQNQSKQAIEVNSFHADVSKDATFTSFVLSLQGNMIRNNVTLNLNGSGCVGNMYGLYILNGKTHVDNHTNVDHTQPHCDSNELYKGILGDSSRGVFNGKIFVRQDAQKTNAFQQNNNILLSEDATVNTKPQLEIWADDVKCSHGCTTGQLDEEAMFYLQARGIGKEQARALLLFAFAGDVIDHIKVDAFKDYCIDLIHETLGTNF
ncbi:Fe-S cluster assembly protein SufD [Anditalea andensis]|uniref:Fe-S cluster assembly protein SufD n=1 Tax=Anditalea andensis TaxID=1048983 RepID=A0A074LK41_9BACT|nr:Fe-S cluster assembly protein SufD [Anditalea andensis]KEO74162.1 Fe-S cluster assembly protein SufD [Anditalea andensis]